jgi:hypothetical protein
LPVDNAGENAHGASFKCVEDENTIRRHPYRFLRKIMASTLPAIVLPYGLMEIFLRLFLRHQNDGRFDRHPSQERFETA